MINLTCGKENIMAQMTNNFARNAIRHGYFPLKNASEETITKLQAKAASVEFLANGFIVNPDEISVCSLSYVEKMLNSARKVAGSDTKFTPMYPNFPQGVRETPTLDLLINQIVHYLSFGTLVPNVEVKGKDPLPLSDVFTASRKLESIYIEDMSNKVIEDTKHASSAVSKDDREFISLCLKFGDTPDIDNAVKSIIETRHRENAQILIEALKDIYPREELAVAIISQARHLDLVLRTVLSLYSSQETRVFDHLLDEKYENTVHNILNGNAKYIKMDAIPRRVRASIASSVNNLSTGYFADNLVKRKNLWKKVFDAIHYFDYVKKKKVDSRPADIIYGNIEYRTLNSHIEDALEKKDIVQAVSLMSEHKPQEILNRLVYLAELSDEKGLVALIEAFKNHGHKADFTKLISLYNGILLSGYEGKRINTAAGQRNIEREGKSLDESKRIPLIEACESIMIEKLKESPAPTSPVSVESNDPVFLSQRDSSTTDRQIDQGEKVSLEGKGDTVRLFMHWKNGPGRVDLDLGATLLDEECNFLQSVTWNSYYGTRNLATYSGDMTSAPGDGAAEYIDIDINGAQSINARYAVMTIYSYTGQRMKDVDHVAGAMKRSGKGERGEIFDARTVVSAFTSESSATRIIPLAYDIQEDVLIWIDTDTGSSYYGGSSANADLEDAMKYVLKAPKFTYGDLARLYAKAHDVETSHSSVNKEDLKKLI